MSSAAPAPSDPGRTRSPAANGTDRRAAWLGFFGDEWGLLLLAATMTFGTWWIVRDSVVKEHTVPDIRVALEVDPKVQDQIGAVLIDRKTITAKLVCSEREKNEAINALKRTGTRSVTLRILDLPTDESRGLSAPPDVFDWPFDDERFIPDDFGMPITGRVFRISSKTVTVAPPTTIRSAEQFEADTNLRADIGLFKKTFDLSGPEGVFDAPLVPDPIAIDPAQFTRREDGSYEGPVEILLTFNQWRTAEPATTWQGVYKRELHIPEIKALVTLTQVGQARIQNRVLVLEDQWRYEFDFRDLIAEKGVIGVIGSNALAYEGTLRGPKKVLDELAKDESKRWWTWGIRLKQDLEAEFKRNGPTDPKPDENGWLSLDGEIIWLPTGARFRNRGVVHEQAGFEKEFTYKVRLRKK